MNRKAGLNLLVHTATEAIQQWARDVKSMRMGILIVIHTFGGDMKWHPHIHQQMMPIHIFPLRFEKLLDIKKGQPFIDPNPEVMRF